MITDIIDFLVDAYNALGSLTNFLRVKYKNYASIIIPSNELGPTIKENVELLLPEINIEVMKSKLKKGYVLVYKIDTKKNRTAITIALLDEHKHCHHAFSVLKNGIPLENIRVPAFWKIGKV